MLMEPLIHEQLSMTVRGTVAQSRDMAMNLPLWHLHLGLRGWIVHQELSGKSENSARSEIHVVLGPDTIENNPLVFMNGSSKQGSLLGTITIKR